MRLLGGSAVTGECQSLMVCNDEIKGADVMWRFSMATAPLSLTPSSVAPSRARRSLMMMTSVKMKGGRTAQR